MALRIKSAIKKHRQSLKRRQRNNNVKSNLKTKVKSFYSAIEENNPELAQERIKSVVSAYDKAATKGVIHKRNIKNATSVWTARISILKISSDFSSRFSGAPIGALFFVVIPFLKNASLVQLIDAFRRLQMCASTVAEGNNGEWETDY